MEREPGGVLDDADVRFLDRRRRCVRTWAVAAVVMLALLVATMIGLAVLSPTLVNPVLVARRLAGGDVDGAALQTASLLLPFAVLGWFVITFVVILLGFAVVHNERRYLRIVDAVLSPPADHAAAPGHDPPALE